jgi:hypothetical protein
MINLALGLIFSSLVAISLECGGAAVLFFGIAVLVLRYAA